MPRPEPAEAHRLAGLLGPGGGAAFDELLQTRERAESILQVVIGDDGALVQDFSGRITYANQPAARMLGVADAASLVRTPPGELLSRLSLEDEESGQRLEALPGSAVLRGAPAGERTLKLTAPGAAPRWLTVRALPMPDSNGALAASVTILRDITEQRQNAEFRERVLAIVSHDLRTPLAAISMTAALVQRRTRTFAPWVAEAAGRMQNSAERAARLVRDLLDLTQAQLGRGLPVERGSLEVVSLVEGVIDELLAAHPERVIELRHRGVDVAHWDADRIRQVLVNLLGNALDHGPAQAPIDIAIDGDPQAVSIAIHNHGGAIPPEQLERLFEPFVRGRPGASGQRSIGLGLYIVKEIVQAHDGTVSVASAPGRGTTFTVRLPHG